MSLTLYFHPLSSFCMKALVGLYELDVPFAKRVVDLANAADRAAFLKVWPILGPAFRAANLATKIIAYDHNCDMPSYPLAVLAGPTASPFVAHASKFVPPGSIRIGNTPTGSLNTAAFRTPAGQTVLLVENDGGDASFTIRMDGVGAPASLVAGAVATYVW